MVDNKEKHIKVMQKIKNMTPLEVWRGTMCGDMTPPYRGMYEMTETYRKGGRKPNISDTVTEITARTKVCSNDIVLSYCDYLVLYLKDEIDLDLLLEEIILIQKAQKKLKYEACQKETGAPDFFSSVGTVNDIAVALVNAIKEGHMRAEHRPK